MFHSLAELALLLIAAVYWIACEYIDTRGRLEFIEKSHPRIWRLVNNRPVRLAGILFCLVLLLRDFRDAVVLPPAPTITLSPTPGFGIDDVRRQVEALQRENEALKNEIKHAQKSVTKTGPVSNGLDEQILIHLSKLASTGKQIQDQFVASDGCFNPQQAVHRVDERSWRISEEEC